MPIKLPVGKKRRNPEAINEAYSMNKMCNETNSRKNNRYKSFSERETYNYIDWLHQKRNQRKSEELEMEDVRKKVYISGPITGTDDYMERFAEAEKEMIDCGYDVINPAKVNAQLPESTSYEQYMKMSLVMLGFADGIYLMKGWEQSTGAKLELEYAKATGKTVRMQEIR